VIRFGELQLRLWTLADRFAVEEIVCASQSEFDGWLPGLVAELNNFDLFVARVSLSARDGTGWYFAIELDRTTVVGQCSLVPNGDGTGEIGYWIRTDRAGAGLATGAVRSVCRFASHLGFSTLLIHCDNANLGSAAVARKAGFLNAGTKRLDPSVIGTSVQTGYERTWVLSLNPPNPTWKTTENRGGTGTPGATRRAPLR
jgi:ribosomal-protein-serine acetyltransferase